MTFPFQSLAVWNFESGHCTRIVRGSFAERMLVLAWTAKKKMGSEEAELFDAGLL